MLEIKNSCCLHHVSGGNYSEGDPNCPGCRGDWDDTDSRPIVNVNDWGGKYSGALSLVGSRFGFAGSVSGYLAGSAIDMVNFQNLGENYKDRVMREIQNGNIPND